VSKPILTDHANDSCDILESQNPDVRMKSKLLHDENGLKTFALVFDKDEEVKESLLRFATENGLRGAQVTGIGAFSEVTLGFFDRKKKSYQEIPVKEQVEVLSFAGNIAEKEGNPMRAPCRRVFQPPRGSSLHIVYLALALLGASFVFVVLLFWFASAGVLSELPKVTPFRKVIIKSGEALRRYRTHLLTMAFAFLITVAAHPAYYTSYYCAGASLHASAGRAASLADILSIMPLVETIVSVPISLEGVGVRETLF